jgi:hypothetical protein
MSIRTSPGRGRGLVYQGTLTAYRGGVVDIMDDCDCYACAQLDPWDPHRRVIATLATGERLLHARLSSFAKAVAAPAEVRTCDCVGHLFTERRFATREDAERFAETLLRMADTVTEKKVAVLAGRWARWNFRRGHRHTSATCSREDAAWSVLRDALAAADLEETWLDPLS